MLGLMQDRPLLLSALITHAERYHGAAPVVSRQADGTLHRSSYGEVAARSRRLAGALRRLGAEPGDRIATLAWNSHRHYELYWAVSGSAMVCHTVNPRLFLDQIAYIAAHAGDRVLFFDPEFLPIAEELARRCPSIRHFVALCAEDEMPASDELQDVLCYETLIDAEDEGFDWPIFDENTASALCYTSGTTGDPKGVLYSHRAAMLHAYASCMPDNFNVSARSTILPGSSMYHANAWGLPYAAALCGAGLVLPRERLDPQSLLELIGSEGVTLSSGVPTIWQRVLHHLDSHGGDLGAVREIIVSGSSCPQSMIERFRREHGVEIVHFWGMTELGPIGTVSRPTQAHGDLGETALDGVRARQGVPAFGVEAAVLDEDGRPLPHDGEGAGELAVRGWWTIERYFGQERSALTGDGWFRTGDVARFDADGAMRITDRSKDVIKSGGEWISSIDLENAAGAHPAVAEAAVFGAAHPDWEERPVLIVALHPGECCDEAGLRAFLAERIARWWQPDAILFDAEIPHTATGKIAKSVLRERYRTLLLADPARR